MPTASSPPEVSANGHPSAPEDALTQVFATQRAHRPTMRRTTAPERIDRLQRLRDALLERKEAIRDALFADFRKPGLEVDLTEIATVVFEIDHAAKHLADWMRPQKVRTPMTLTGTASEIRVEPKGTVLIISPWNYPVNLTLSPLVSAIAAGCTAILKPSEYTPHTSALLGTLVRDLFPPEEVALFEGDASVAQALLELPFDHIFFTGSPAIGKKVMRAAAEHLTSVTLELGGKSPTIVDATANIEVAARKIAFAKFANCGQTCIAPDYVYVDAEVHDALVEALAAEIQSLYGRTTDARRQTMDYARIVNRKHHERLSALLSDALDRGAQVRTGGTTQVHDYFIDPTVLTDVPLAARVMQEEIFGPLLPVLAYASLDEALSVINDKPKPLALYLFSQDDATVEHVLTRTSAGGTCVNDALLHFLHPELPFGGVGTSGMGTSHGHRGFLEFSHERAVLRQKLASSPLQKLYPPYTRISQFLVDTLLRWW